jgi:hypothetical protein
MKIHQLLSGLSVPVTNEEQQFMNQHVKIRISSLNERDQRIAHNLVRKGVYSISNDNVTLIKQTNETTR